MGESQIFCVKRVKLATAWEYRENLIRLTVNAKRAPALICLKSLNSLDWSINKPGKSDIVLHTLHQIASLLSDCKLYHAIFPDIPILHSHEGIIGILLSSMYSFSSVYLHHLAPFPFIATIFITPWLYAAFKVDFAFCEASQSLSL